MRESGIDPAAQAGACTVSAGMWGAGGGGDVQKEKGEEEAEEGLQVDFDEDRGHFFAKWSEYVRSGPCIRPIRWPRKAGDVATLGTDKNGDRAERNWIMDVE